MQRKWVSKEENVELNGIVWQRWKIYILGFSFPTSIGLVNHPDGSYSIQFLFGYFWVRPMSNLKQTLEDSGISFIEAFGEDHHVAL